MVRPFITVKFCVAGLLAALACAPTAAAPAVATARAKVTMLEPLTVLNTAPLSFGNIAPGAVPGTVTVTPLGDIVHNGGTTGLGGEVSAATFLITISGSKAAKVGTPKRAITLTRQGGGATMNVRAFTNIQKKKVKLDSGADVYEVTVGGTLSVGANQAEGDYLGQFDVTFDHQ